jgi:IS30 family transposase
MLVITDRAPLHTSLHKLENRHSEVVSKSIINRLRELAYPMHTVTFDNDKGFANHMDLANNLNVKTYFIRPYTSQDKGTVEKE